MTAITPTGGQHETRDRFGKLTERGMIGIDKRHEIDADALCGGLWREVEHFRHMGSKKQSRPSGGQNNGPTRDAVFRAFSGKQALWRIFGVECASLSRRTITAPATADGGQSE